MIISYFAPFVFASGFGRGGSAAVAFAHEDTNFIGDLYKREMVGTLVQWLQSGMTLSSEQMINRIDVAMHGAVLAALQRSSERS